MEEKISPISVSRIIDIGQSTDTVGDSHAKTRKGEPAAIHSGIHQIETTKRVSQQTDAWDQSILEEDIDRIFRLREPGFHRGETQMHDKHQRGGQHHPDVVNREQRETRGFRECRQICVFGRFFSQAGCFLRED